MTTRTDEQAGLRDFWSVYDDHYESACEAALAFRRDHLEFEPPTSAMSAEQWATQNQSTRDLLRRAILDGDWEPYAEDLRVQGLSCAKRGVTVAGWHETTRALQKFLVPHLIESFIETPDRLARAVTAMEEFIARGMAVIAESYVVTKVEDQLRPFIESVRDYAIYSLDAEGRITSWNAGAKAVLGYEPEEIIGQHFSVLFTAEDREKRVPEREMELALRGDMRVAEGWRVRKDGTRRWASSNLTVVRDATARVIGFTKVTRDMSEFQKAQEEHRLLQERLRQAQKLEALGRLAGGVAHDFNNVLSVILSYSGMLIDDSKSSDPILQDLKEIHAAGLRATDLTRQLLAFGRKQILQPAPTNLNDVLAGMERMLLRLLGEDIELTVLPAPSLGTAHMDPGQLEQVVMNLAVNARDAMPRGGKLTIETRNVELDAEYAAQHSGVEPGPHVLLAISDTGIGMDEATRGRIFEPFFTTKGPGQGTGLGLATVHGIIKQSGGHIWVYSEPANGTTFKIYLPQTQDKAAADASASIRPPGSAPPPGGTETILLVEDEEHVRVLVRTILRRLGYHVLEAQSGGDALLICEQHGATIHLMVTDVVMPRLSGRQLAERLETIRPEMKVLYMSGYTDNSIVHHGVLDSGVAFLQKPVTPGALGRKVREVLDSHGATRPGEPGSSHPKG